MGADECRCLEVKKEDEEVQRRKKYPGMWSFILFPGSK